MSRQGDRELKGASGRGTNWFRAVQCRWLLIGSEDSLSPSFTVSCVLQNHWLHRHRLWGPL